MVSVLAQPRHHDAPLDSGDNVLRKDIWAYLNLQIPSLIGLTQDFSQDLRPIAKDSPYQLSDTIIRVAQFQSGVAEQSATDEPRPPVLFEDRIEEVGQSGQGQFTVQTP